MSTKTAVEGLWKANGLPHGWLSRLLLNSTPDPCVNSSFKLGTAAQVSSGFLGTCLPCLLRFSPQLGYQPLQQLTFMN